MHRGLHIRPCREDAGVQHAFQIRPQTLGIDRDAVEGEFQEVVAADQLGRAGTGYEEAVRPVRVPDGHMPEIVEHAFTRQDPVGDHQVAEQRVQALGHAGTCGQGAWGAPRIERFMDNSFLFFCEDRMHPAGVGQRFRPPA